MWRQSTRAALVVAEAEAVARGLSGWAWLDLEQRRGRRGCSGGLGAKQGSGGAVNGQERPERV